MARDRERAPPGIKRGPGGGLARNIIGNYQQNWPRVPQHRKPAQVRPSLAESRPRLDKEDRHRKDPTAGKPLYAPIIEIRGNAERERFHRATLVAVDKLLDGGTA